MQLSQEFILDAVASRTGLSWTRKCHFTEGHVDIALAAGL